MSLIDRYVQEVGSHLPVKQRHDIQEEIKSLIQDMLDEKSATAGRPVDDAMTLEVIKSMGRPEQVAATYLPPRYLIGPVLFPTFWLVLKIVLAVVALIGVVIFAIRVAIGDLNAWLTVGESFSDIFNWMIVAVGWVVVTFAIIERVSPSLKINGKEKDWDPAELLKKPDFDKIPLSTPITGIIFTLAALVIFNLFPGIPVVKSLQDGEWMILMSLSDAFLSFMPLINVLWVLTVAFHCVTLVQRRWSSFTRLLYIGLQFFGIVIVVFLLNAGDLIDINMDTMNVLNTTGAAPENLADIMNIIVRVSLGIAIAAAIMQIGTTLYKWVTHRNN